MKGAWLVSGGANPYGEDSVYSKTAGHWHASRFDALARGEYRVYLRWTTYASRQPSVPVDAAHAAGVARVAVNQQGAGGQWVALGTWAFDATARVTILCPGGGYSVCEDAVKIEPARP